MPKRFLFASLVLFFAGCSVKTGVVQQSIESYYACRLAASASAESAPSMAACIEQRIAALTRELDASPRDAGLLAERANAQYELLLLDEGASMAELVDGLRLLEGRVSSLVEAEAWIDPNTVSLAGDMLLVRASREQARCGGDPSCMIRAREIYRLAADFFLHAQTAAVDARETVNPSRSFAAEIARALDSELSRARVGYGTALTGMAMMEVSLGMDDDARSHLTVARSIMASGAAPAADANYISAPRSFDAERHRMLASQTRALASLSMPANPTEATAEQLKDSLTLREFALKEELAARIFSSRPLAGIADDAGIKAVFDLLKAKSP